MPEDLPLVYLDSCVYLDLITRNEELQVGTEQPRWKIARKLFNAWRSNRIMLAASPLVEAEVLCNGDTTQRRRRSDAVEEKLKAWFTSPSVMWVDVDRFLAREAASLRLQYGHLHESGKKAFGAADALHLAAAIRARCAYFMTQDGGFPLGKQIDELKVERPRVVWDPTLFDEA